MNCPLVTVPLLSLGRWSGWVVAALLCVQQAAWAQATPDNTASGTATPSGNASAETLTTAPGTPPLSTVVPAATPAPSGPPSLASPRKAPALRDTHPTWSELSRDQKHALKPLAQVWPSLSELHKRKWLVLSQNFSELSVQEQHKLQERMSDWTSLTAQERAQARLHFAEVQQLPGDERRAKWEAYQALSDEQRRKLADDILLTPPRGAAVASRPVAPSKLTQPPAPKPDQALQPRIDTDQIHPKTLLPHFLQGTSTR
jgi:hypothetical protein